VLINNPKGESFLKGLINDVERIEEIPIEKTLSTPNRFNSDGHYGPYEQRRFFTEKLKSPDSKFSDAVSKALHEKYDIGLVTALSHNYGGNLTYYALFRYLKSLGKTVLIIDRRKDSPAPPHSDPFRTFEKVPYLSWEVCNNIKNKKELRELNNKCDLFLLGSDQMLHPNFILKFGEHTCMNWVYSYKPKIAYAASYGKDTFEGTSEFKSAVGEMLRRFDHFSVRERSAVELSKRIFDVDAVQVLDPVFMLNADEYLEFSSNGKIKFPEKYIGAYILDPNEHKSKMLKDVASRNDLPVSIVKDTYADLKKYFHYGLTPLENVKVEDWVNNIANCEVFVTDSFHGACFAIIFKKPVIILDNPLRGSTRISSLVDMFGLRKVLVDSTEYVLDDLLLESKSIDWRKIHKKLRLEIKHSKTWLNEALKCIEKQNLKDDFDEKWDQEIGTNKTISSSKVNSKDSAQEFVENLELAKSGDSSAQRRISLTYRKGIGIEKNLDYSIEWIRKAVESHEYMSWNELVDCLLERGTEEDLAEAFSIATDFATDGAPGISIRLARMYRDGKGTAIDLDKAIEWMQIAYQNEEQWSWNELIDLLNRLSGIYLEKAYAIALNYAERGDPGANVRLARMHYRGMGAERNLDKAIEIMRVAADKGNRYGMNELVDYLLERDKPEDVIEAKSVASALAKNGDGRAQEKCNQYLF
jgi:TPR repeat protein